MAPAKRASKRRSQQGNGTPRKGNKSKQTRRTIETRRSSRNAQTPADTTVDDNTNGAHGIIMQHCNANSPTRPGQVITHEDTPPGPDPPEPLNEVTDDGVFRPRILASTL